MSARAPLYVRASVRLVIAAFFAALFLLAIWQPLIVAGFFIALCVIDVLVDRHRRTRLNPTV